MAHADHHGRDPGRARRRRRVMEATPSTAARTLPDRLAHVPALDGLRGLAVLAVMVYHMNYPIGHSTLLRGGFLGVDVFFVLSGYLITSLLLIAHARTGHVVSVAFWARRVRRLLPALLVLLVMVALYGVFVSKPYERTTVRGGALATLFYVQNYWQIFSNYHFRLPALHTWSLSIEEQFYLIWPILLAGLLRALRTITRISVALVAMIVASVIAMAIEFSVKNPFHAYMSTEARAHSLLAGALLSVVTLGWRGPTTTAARYALQIAGWLGVGYLAFLAWNVSVFAPWLYHGGYLLVAVAAAAVIAAAVQPTSGALARMLSWRPLTAIGLISYGLYLYHIPVYYVLDTKSFPHGVVLLQIVRVAIAFSLATASYFLIERPVRAGRFPRVRLRVAVPIAATAMTAILFVMSIGATSVPASLTIQYAYYRRALASPATDVRVLVAGDVFAAQFSRYQPSGFVGDGVSAAVVHPYACGITSGDILVHQRALKGSNCDSVFGDFDLATRAFAPQAAVLMVGSSEILDRVVAGHVLRVGTPALEHYLDQQLDHTRRVLTAQGARLVLATVPCMEPPSTGPYSFLAPFDRDRNRVDWVNGVWRRYAARHQSVTLADLDGFLCPDGVHRAELKGRALGTSDGFGFTPLGVGLIWRWLAPIAIKAGRHAVVPPPVGP
jgi:peptidoglycan/LPS O-acetylase OafA/YrhL